MEIPKFLLEMSKQMNDQDNRCTSEPVWVVCYDEWLTCADDRGDKTQLLVSDGDSWNAFDEVDEFISYLIDNKNGDGELDKVLDLHECEDLYDLIQDFDDAELYCGELNLESVESIDMQRVVHKIKYCLTEADANWFIKRKQHDYSKLYTYVESMNHCPQMIELRNWIMSLSR